MSSMPTKPVGRQGKEPFDAGAEVHLIGRRQSVRKINYSKQMQCARIAERIHKFYNEIAIPAESFARAVAFAMSQPHPCLVRRGSVLHLTKS
jgi:hypothetical protein